MGCSDGTWYVGRGGKKYYQHGLSSPNGKNFRTLYVGSSSQKYYPHGWLSAFTHIQYLKSIKCIPVNYSVSAAFRDRVFTLLSDGFA